MVPIPGLRNKEVCLISRWVPTTELVGTYLLNVLSKKYNKNDFGLYQDDGLAVLKKKSGPQSEQVKKKHPEDI